MARREIALGVAGVSLLATPALAADDAGASASDVGSAVAKLIEACGKDRSNAVCVPILAALHAAAPSRAAAASQSGGAQDGAQAGLGRSESGNQAPPAGVTQAKAADNQAKLAAIVTDETGAPSSDKGSSWKLEGNSDQGNGSVTLNFDSPLGYDPKRSTQTMSVKLSAPIGSGAAYQNIASLDGLIKSTSIALQYSWIFSQPSPHNSSS